MVSRLNAQFVYVQPSTVTNVCSALARCLTLPEGDAGHNGSSGSNSSSSSSHRTSARKRPRSDVEENADDGENQLHGVSAEYVREFNAQVRKLFGYSRLKSENTRANNGSSSSSAAAAAVGDDAATSGQSLAQADLDDDDDDDDDTTVGATTQSTDEFVPGTLQKCITKYVDWGRSLK